MHKKAESPRKLGDSALVVSLNRSLV